MKTPVLATATSLSILAVLLSGCTNAPTETPTQTAAATQAGPDPVALREALRDIDPGLDDEASADDAGAVCLEIQAGEDDATVAETARELFSARADGDLTDDQVAEIVEAVKTHFCR